LILVSGILHSMTILQAVTLGIVEGITEFLPISSTGHLILLSHILMIPENATLKSFQIAVQLGAILAVFVFFFKKFFDTHILKRLFVAFLPTGILGFTLYKLIKNYLIGNELVVVLSLFIGGILMLFVEGWYKKTVRGEERHKDIRDFSYTECLKLGLFQSIAMIPGVSRSGATIIGGLWMRLPRPLLAEFTFLLAVPTMAAATGYDLLKNYKEFSPDDITVMLAGFMTAFIVAFIVVKWLLSYIKTKDFSIFGWYRIILAVVFSLVFLL
jgi:undecaprenyl-diphosphatase